MRQVKGVVLQGAGGLMERGRLGSVSTPADVVDVR